MKSEQLTFDEAYERVRTIRKQVKINSGFIRQLKVWEVIKDDFPNRETYAEYQLWKLSFHNKVVACNSPWLSYTSFLQANSRQLQQSPRTMVRDKH